MRVVITGAAGRIGREIVEELSGSHDLCLIDRVRVPGRSSIVADLSRKPARNGLGLSGVRARVVQWEDALVRADVLLHLAANANPESSAEAVLADNIQATWNVFDAAARGGVRRVVFASSCRWVLGLHPYMAVDWDQIRISSSTTPRPRTPYGLSKAWGELAGRMYVDTGRVSSMVAIRIGSFSEGEPRDPEVRRLWVRPGDLRAVLRRCVEAEFDGFHVVYAVSREAAGPFDLSCTRELLGWEP